MRNPPTVAQQHHVWRRLSIGHICPILSKCEGAEFIRRVHRYAKDHGLSFEWRPDLGKGGHGILILGDRRTVVRNPKDELKTGTMHAMLKQLGLSREDI